MKTSKALLGFKWPIALQRWYATVEDPSRLRLAQLHYSDKSQHPACQHCLTSAFVLPSKGQIATMQSPVPATTAFRRLALAGAGSQLALVELARA